MTASDDIAPELVKLLGVTGGLEESGGVLRIQVYHTTAFPWAAVFKLLLYRDFKVTVCHRKADIYIEAQTLSADLAEEKSRSEPRA